LALVKQYIEYNDTQIYHYADKLAILLGSLFSGIIGYLVLRGAKASVKNP